MLRWEQGRADVNELLAKKHLERVSANIEHAEKLIAQARLHVASSATLRDSDLSLAFTGAYDAARKALTAILAVQGLRPTSAGGHLAVYHSSLAQFEPPMGKTIKPFDWMRRTRNETEYPDADSSGVHIDDVEEAIVIARDIIEFATKLVQTLPPFGK